MFSATAARMSAFNAFSSILSPSWKSMARLVLPSRLELKRPAGSSNEAPLAKVIFTIFLYVSPVQIIPACDHTGTPLHFHSSTTSGSACLMRIRTRASVSALRALGTVRTMTLLHEVRRGGFLLRHVGLETRVLALLSPAVKYEGAANKTNP